MKWFAVLYLVLAASVQSLGSDLSDLSIESRAKVESALALLQNKLQLKPPILATSVKPEFLKILGQSAAPTNIELLAWIDQRVKTVLEGNHEIRSGEDIYYNNIPGILMLNITSEAWFQKQAFDKNLYIDNELRVMKSAEEGQVQLGPELSNDSSDLIILKTLVHEARHSDCKSLDLKKDVSLFREGRSSEIEDCAYFHSICPDTHDLAGMPACDVSALGAYNTEALFLEYLQNTCQNCTISQKLEIKALSIEAKSRLVERQGLVSQNVPQSAAFGRENVLLSLTKRLTLLQALPLGSKQNIIYQELITFFETLPNIYELRQMAPHLASHRRTMMAVQLSQLIAKLHEIATKRHLSVHFQKTMQICQELTTREHAPWPKFLGEICKESAATF